MDIILKEIVAIIKEETENINKKYFSLPKFEWIFYSNDSKYSKYISAYKFDV